MEENWLDDLQVYEEQSNSNEIDYDLIAEALEKSHKVTVLTGAGISVKAGVPDFRFVLSRPELRGVNEVDQRMDYGRSTIQVHMVILIISKRIQSHSGRCTKSCTN